MFDARTACVVVVGAQWGDEGKGKLVDVLAERADFVVRYQGGANAGHTVVIGDSQFILRQIPVRHPPPAGHLRRRQRRGARPGDLLRRAGPARGARHRHDRPDLRLRPRPPGASVPQAARRGEREEPEDRHDGTRHRSGLRGQVRPPRRAGHRSPASRLCPLAAGGAGGARQSAAGDDGHGRACLLSRRTSRCSSASRRDCSRSRPTPGSWSTGPCARDAGCCWRARRARCSTWTTGPIPTSPAPTPPPAEPRSAPGSVPTLIHGVLGVVKAYTTRVGNGPLPTEAESPYGERLRELGGEFGAVTGRPRRCGWFDATVVRYAARVNGLTGLAVTKLDVLDSFAEIPVVHRLPARWRALRRDAGRGRGLGTGPAGLRAAPGLGPPHRRGPEAGRPAAEARAYLDRLQELSGVPVRYVSVGTRRDQIIEVA